MLTPNPPSVTTRAYRWAFESKEDKHRRIYNESMHQTCVALRSLEREIPQTLAKIEVEKRAFKREYQQFGKDAIIAHASNIAFLQKQFERAIWMKTRLKALISDTQLARGTLDITKTLALLNRGMSLLNDNDDFRETYISFQRNAAEFQFKVEEIEGFVAFDEDDFYEEQDADKILQRVTDEIMYELGLPNLAAPHQPIEPNTDPEAEHIAQQVESLTAPSVDLVTL